MNNAPAMRRGGRSSIPATARERRASMVGGADFHVRLVLGGGGEGRGMRRRRGGRRRGRRRRGNRRGRRRAEDAREEDARAGAEGGGEKDATGHPALTG